MKKKIRILVLAALVMAMLAGCACEHEWAEADCVTPKTCTKCEETEGSPLGHSWLAATCESAKTCEICGTVEGEAPGHNWVEATCESAKTCEVCGLTEGEVPGHDWADATTESPKTCNVCGLTEGEPIVTDPRFTTAEAAPYFGTWSMEYPMSAEEMGLTGYEGEVIYHLSMTFCNDGTVTTDFAVDMESLAAMMESYLAQELYAQFEAEGYTREEADAEMEAYYGMNVEEYAVYAAKSLNATDFNTSVTTVYYVEGGVMYTGLDWDQELEAEDCSLNGNVLTMSTDDGLVELTKVEE